MREVLKYSFIALAGIAILAGLWFRGGGIERAGDEGELTLQELIGNPQPTDPALIGYDEIAELKVNLNTLRAIAVAQDDLIYVSGDSVLVVLQGSGREVSRFAWGASAGCLAVSPDGSSIYLGMKDHIRVLDKNGSTIGIWKKINSAALLTSIAATETDVFAADAGNKVVWRYDTSGDLLGKIGERNAEEGKIGFVIPSPYFDVAIDRDGLLWAVNPGRHALENYTLDGELRSSWERTSAGLDGFCGCCNPIHMAILPNGSFVTSEKGIARVKIHDPTGEFHTVVAAPELFAEGTDGLDLALDSQERILVLDPKAGVVRIFLEKQ
jgi:hypothetical protein